LYRKGHGHEARLAYFGHLVIENRHGLMVDALASTAGRTSTRRYRFAIRDRGRTIEDEGSGMKDQG
jgi:hypothetical protein